MSLENNIKEWVILDNESKNLNEKIKEIRDKKNNLSNSILEYCNEKNINPTINISDGRLKLISTQQGNIISLKFLLECFNEFFNDEKKADELLDFIKSKRTFTNVQSIKRIYN